VAAKDIGSSKELLHADASAEMLVSTAATSCSISTAGMRSPAELSV